MTSDRSGPARPPSAMAFYHSDGMVSAWNHATEFAGEGGRVATIPDIIAARLACPINSAAWMRYFTTSSSEFLGLSPGGKKVIAVLHGGGPMANISSVAAAYSYQFKDRSSNREGGRISAGAFHHVLSGRYGTPFLVDYAAYVSGRRYPFLERNTEDEARVNPLAAARIGPAYLSYLERHATEARTLRREWAGESGSRLHPAAGNLIRFSEPSRPSYVYSEPEDGLAFAHLLSIGQLARTGGSGSADTGDTLECDLSPHSWNDGTRLVGIRADAHTGDIHPGFDFSAAVRDPQRREVLWEANKGPPGGFCRLIRIGRDLYTQYPKIGAGMDNGAPEFAVLASEPAGDPFDVTVQVGGYHGFLKYNIAEFRAAAPEGANAYDILDVTLSADGDRQHVTTQFFKITADYSRRLLKETELIRDFKRMLEAV